MSKATAIGLFLGAFAAACGGNNEPADRVLMKIAVHVESDPGVPLPAASVIYKNNTVLTTNDDGVAKLDLRGRQGDVYTLSVVCPKGFASPSKDLDIVLKTGADPSKPPEYDVTCPPETRTAVVAVRAENGAGLPVKYLGREVARTDKWGAAHVVLSDLKRDAQFDLEIDTSIRGAEALQPQSPTKSFTLKGRDDLFAFDQRFTIKAKVVKYGPAKRAPVALPTRATP
ncbi:MAG: hypothetical protein ACHREM_08000 [Polyangiales bacterium]